MKPIARQSRKKAAFTIVEIMTVMSIIIILIGLLVPGLTMVRRFAKDVKQRNQFHGIGNALEVFNAEWEGYPPSNENALTMPKAYCGAMKLAEAMVGQDGLGFHPQADFVCPDACYNKVPNPDLSVRRQYLQTESANAYMMSAIYLPTHLGPFDPNIFVFCDVYGRVTNLSTGQRKIGMPVLYYKADTSKTRHSKQAAISSNSIYDYRDNDMLARCGMPWESTPFQVKHPLFEDPDKGFYVPTRSDKIVLPPDNRPYRADSYILLSAGHDGEYGTGDDIFNFSR